MRKLSQKLENPISIPLTPTSASGNDIASTSTGQQMASSVPQVVYAENVTIAIEPPEGSNSSDSSDEEIARITSQMKGASIYDITHNRAGGTSCIPRRDNFTSFKASRLLTRTTDVEEAYDGPDEGNTNNEVLVLPSVFVTRKLLISQINHCRPLESWKWQRSNHKEPHLRIHRILTNN
jgi:hypothetical protein